MTDLANASQLSKTSMQLPLNWYFDPKVLEAELNTVFAQGPGYVGHELMVPNAGNYQTLEWMGNSKSLVRNETGVELLSNVCRHRQSILLKGRGNVKNIVCPLHRWTYGLDGKLLGAPHFPENPCLNLSKTPLQRWNGMLFAGKRDAARDLARLSVTQDVDFSGYVFDRMTIDDYQCNWKTFVEVYQELYHVNPFHPGLGSFVDADNFKWEFGDWYSVQIMGVNQGLSKPGSPVYERWHQQVLRYYEGKEPPYGALWMTYYPNIMLEWYPQTLVISTVIPRTPETCTNIVEFYYPEEIALFERGFVEAEQAAYMESALEDAEICIGMNHGRKLLYEQGINETGPYQTPWEDGMAHFHEFLRRHIEPQLKG